MNRRTFVAVSASAVAATATNAAAGIPEKRPSVAKEPVTLSGWIRPGTRGPGHYFILGPHADVADPRAANFDQWPEGLTLVYPADTAALRPGPATLRGRLHRGRYKDHVTGHFARAVLTEATLV
ncbi:MAG TPA: hypothetical protein VN694_09000 [Caulobacteraceae bacterium]|nr:hypothetical protein [Caulobacteraceae bacterium]